MAVSRSKTLAFAAIAIAALLHSSVAQTTHTVGGNTGWTIPQGGDSVYSNWASGNSFSVGDILVFNFAVGIHDVTQVSKANYDACSASDPMLIATTSPARVTLNSSGEHYFICGFPGHCSAGQKVTVNVLASTSAPSPAPMASSSPAPRRALTPASAPSPASTASAPTPSTSPVSESRSQLPASISTSAQFPATAPPASSYPSMSPAKPAVLPHRGRRLPVRATWPRRRPTPPRPSPECRPPRFCRFS
ncbi:unnamed protein product [Linum tenue]|uniref:Phytocyanin domain-containing protein n=1 Tax=Linum tenue TaxID=586396 RepID=A0AAV0SB63_9ROSI|nr:unnamed protein product [Linum tenue]